MKRRHNMPVGAHFGDNGSVRFRLWAPAARKVDLCLVGSIGSKALSMEPCMEPRDQGWFELATDAAKAGTQYRFRIDGGQEVYDPAFRFQAEGARGASGGIEREI